MSWTNHLDSRTARVSRIDYRWRLRRKLRRAAIAAASASCAHNSPPIATTAPRGSIETTEETRTTCLLNPSIGETNTSPTMDLPQ